MICCRPGGRAAARALTLALVLSTTTLASAACSRGESRPAHDASAPRASGGGLARGAVPHDVTLPGLAPSQPAYTVRPAPDAGRVAGTVVLDGPAPADTVVTPSSDDARTCGRTLTVPALEARGPGGGVPGVVVWLVGVGAGKPLPAARRDEIALEGCVLRPHIVAAVAGGALNVHGIDALDARLRFTQVEGGTPATPPGTVLLRVTTTDAGQVVPSERVVAAPGTVEARGEFQPWLRGWVLTFDHPYFATTDAAGAFALDGVPPGTYQLVAWHDRLGRVAQSVTVAPGQAAAVTVRMAARR